MSDSDPALLFNSVARAPSDCGVGILHGDEQGYTDYPALGLGTD